MISTTKTDEDIRDCENMTDLANLLGLNLKTLLFLAYKNEHLYKHYRIKKKSGGYRDIHAPDEALKTACKKLNYHLSEVYEEYIPNSVHGFVYNRGIVSNAERHLVRKYVLNVDLENFFETVNSGRIMGLFKRHPFRFSKNLRSVLAGLTTYENHLPQGSPCSPVLANMICFRLDKEMIRLASKHGWRYTRYADDITISCNELDDNLATIKGEKVLVGEKIIHTIEKNGFTLNPKKTRLAVPNASKWVTGVKVNKKCNVSRKRIRQARAMLNAWEVYGEDRAEEEFNRKYNPGRNKKYSEVLRGRIDHIGNVRGKDDIIYRRLYNRLCDLEGKYENRLPETLKDIYLDKVLIIKSSQGYGSGFFINDQIIVTCAHVVESDRNVTFTTRDKKMPVEFKGASVLYVDKEKDIAILYTASRHPELMFNCSHRKTHQAFNTDEEYVSIGYGGFRTDDAFWSDPAAVDQKIVQKEELGGINSYRVSNAMWSGMSGGPMISKKSGKVDGYIVEGAQTQEGGTDIKSFKFYPVSNIPIEYIKIEKPHETVDFGEIIF